MTSLTVAIHHHCCHHVYCCCASNCRGCAGWNSDSSSKWTWCDRGTANGGGYSVRSDRSAWFKVHEHHQNIQVREEVVAGECGWCCWRILLIFHCQEWCKSQKPAFTNSDIVSESKLIMFLDEVVYKQVVSVKQKPWAFKKSCVGTEQELEMMKKSWEENEELDEEVERLTSLKYKSVESAYISSVMDLWKEQVSQGLIDLTHPCGCALRGLLKEQKQKQDTIWRRAFEDRALGMILEGYMSVQLTNMCNWALEQLTSLEQWLKICLNFLMGHFLCIRGENCMNLELCDMFTVSLLNEGYQTCQALIVTFQASKTNKDGHLRQMRAIWGKDIFVCLLEVLVTYLFYRYDITDESFSDLCNNSTWFNIKVLWGGKDIYTSLEYDTALDWTSHLYTLDNIIGASKCHMPQKRTVQTAEDTSISEGQICDCFHWIY